MQLDHCGIKHLGFRLRVLGLTLGLLATVACGGGSSSSSITTGGGGGGGSPFVTLMSLSPTNASTTVGNTEQFTATATYSDNSTKDVTTAATWSSSDTS